MRAPVPSTRTVRVLVVFAFLVGAAAIAWLFYETLTLSVEEQAAKVREGVATEQRDRLSAAVAQQGQAIAEANHRLEQAGKAPVVVPPTPSTVPQVSEFRIAQAVAAYLAVNPVKNGTNGPTTAQVVAEVTPEVQAAVQSYLVTHPAPAGKPGATGPAGAAGKNGTNGANGSPGAVGPGPSDAQVAAGVKAYCDAHNGCQGPAGPTGATGPTGDTGPAGTPAVPFTFTFTVQDNPVQSTTYTCTVTAPNTTATCSKN